MPRGSVDIHGYQNIGCNMRESECDDVRYIRKSVLNGVCVCVLNSVLNLVSNIGQRIA